MQVFTSIADVGRKLKGGAIAVGNFDGLHLGHEALLKKVCEVAAGKPTGVLTFSPHPRQILCPEKTHFCLTSDSQRMRIFAQFGLDVAVIHHLTRDFLSLSPQRFIDDVLVNALNISQLVVGDDFRFGASALGDIALLEAPINASRFTTHVVPPVFCGPERCSSSSIRHSLGDANLDLSAQMLGRNFSLAGLVVHGQGRGADLGFKTANLVPTQGFGLKKGVYATVVRTFAHDGPRDFVACTNVGVRPSIAVNNPLTVESHLLDVDLGLYGQEIEVFFIERLRDEMAFSSIKSLVAQVQIDRQTVYQMWHRFPHRFQLAS